MKNSIIRRFENRTDTYETWDMLQEDCLLARRAGPKPAHEPRPSTLLQRLNQASSQEQPPSPRPGEREYHSAAKPAVADTGTGAATSGAAWSSTPERVPCGLTVLASQRFARLPDHGDVVVGRFVPGFSNPPDIDLTLEEGQFPSVSRRHALLIGNDRQHWIEDMGSANGTYINGHPLPVGKSKQLAPGDRILLGRCRLMYDFVPDWVLQPGTRTTRCAVLVITHSNHRFDLPHTSEMVVGRSDPSIGFVPAADVSVAGEISYGVSRRHVTILSRNGSHFVQEAGSASGTRLNGRPIRVGEPPVMLRHGDQLWLGGCVLAYEWRPPKEESKP